MAKNEDLRGKIIAKAWKDPAFRKKLISKPKETLREMGYTSIADNMEVRIQEDDARHFTFVLPPIPTQIKELNDEQLLKIAAAGQAQHAFTTGLDL